MHEVTLFSECDEEEMSYIAIQDETDMHADQYNYAL